MSRRAPFPALVTAAAVLLGGLATAPVAFAGDKGDLPAPSTPSERRVAANAALERVEAIFDGTAPAADRRSATMALRDLNLVVDDLSAADQASAEDVGGRPTSTDQVRCDEYTCVHYATGGADAVNPTDDDANGHPDYVDLVLATVDDVRSRLVAGGYRPPLPDGTSGGGPQVDIYLADFGGGVYGYCNSDDPSLGYALSAFCALDNDFDPVQYGAPALDSLQATVAHEYFHAVQFGYDYYEDRWLMEATATWAEDELFDDVNDSRQYLDFSPLRYPQVPLDYAGDGFYYGTWIFFRHLSEKFPKTQAGLPIIVRDIWQQADASVGAPDYFSIAAVTKALRNRSTTLPRVLASFAIANRTPKSSYSEGAAYPSAPYKGVLVRPSTRNPGGVAATLDHLSSATIRYVPKGMTQRDWRLKLAFNLQNTSRGSYAAVRVVKRSGSSSTSLVSLDSRGDATVRLPFSDATVTAIEVTLLNTSIRYDCWIDPSSPFSCAGYSRDDDLRQVVDPIAYRS